MDLAVRRSRTSGWFALAAILVIAVMALAPVLSSAAPMARCPAGHGVVMDGTDCAGDGAAVAHGDADCCLVPAGLPTWGPGTEPDGVGAHHPASATRALVAIEPAAADPPPRRRG